MFKSNGYRSPTSVASGPLQHTFTTDLPSFEYWATLSGDVLQNFNTYMTGNRSSRPSWIEWFPVEHSVLRGAKEDDGAVLIVDVAGGRGHYLETFRQRFHNAKGRMILQDLPHVISDVQDLDPRIESMAGARYILAAAYRRYLIPHVLLVNQSSSQTVLGARVYFLHFVLYDWSNALAA